MPHFPGRQRANLAAQLKDTKSVVGRLKSVIGVCLHLVCIFFYLVIYNVNVEKLWVQHWFIAEMYMQDCSLTSAVQLRERHQQLGLACMLTTYIARPPRPLHHRCSLARGPQAPNVTLSRDRSCVLQVFISSVFLGFAFMFGNSVKNLFEAVIFLFVVHPFDTGDALIIDSLLYVVRARIHLDYVMQAPIPWDD